MIILSDNEFNEFLEKLRDETLKNKSLQELLQGFTPLNKNTDTGSEEV